MSALLLHEVRRRGRVVDVLLAGGRVVAVGDDLRAAATGLDPLGDVEVVEAGGAVLLPGLVDAHVHLTQWAAARRRVDVLAAASAAEVADVLAAAAGTGGDLLVGHGYRDALWTRPAHRDVLDARFPDRPVLVVSADLHAAWVNSAAARRFGVDDPTGVLREAPAMRLLTTAGDVGDAVLDRWVAEATAAAAARGVTGLVDLEYAPITAWARRERPAVRVEAGVWTDWLEEAVEAGLRTGDLVPGAPGRVRVGPVKFVVDGSLGTRTAFCREEYPSGGHGVLRLRPEELEPGLRRATSHGLAVAVHAIGDDAVRVALDAFEATAATGSLEHAQQVHPQDLPRFARLGVVASIQPRHAVDDRDAVERHWPTGAGRAYPYAALLAAGAQLRLGSDAPVAPLDPWDAVASAVHRSVDERDPWRPDQHLPLDVALAAACGGRRDVHVGDRADLVLVADDPARAFANGGADALRRTEVLATVLGGEFTHRAGT
ncbi:amidohydrolase [Kineococcus sp. SYSU DK001]|uniref:amidohydrolase n=1 Tax=Kineococcus sp. SYSU DK001 TaxID=3383122 RepID=UPI003D7CB136